MAKTTNYNYSNLSLEELYRVTQDIDRNSNPDAYAAAVAEIVRKQKMRDAKTSRVMPVDAAEPELHSNSSGMIGALVGAAGAIVWMSLSPQTTPLATLDTQPIVVQVGMILLGICIGALVGACFNVFTRDER